MMLNRRVSQCKTEENKMRNIKGKKFEGGSEEQDGENGDETFTM